MTQHVSRYYRLYVDPVVCGIFSSMCILYKINKQKQCVQVITVIHKTNKKKITETTHKMKQQILMRRNQD